ncbi:MAG TPA: aldehyde dehydrogenase family protein [bacterium]
MEGQNFIAGKWQSTPKTYTRYDPAHPDQVVAVYPRSEREVAKAALEAARTAFPLWRKTPIIERARILQRAARVLDGRFEERARDLAREVGKPIFEARGEVRRAIDLLDYYASFAWQPQGFVLASARASTELRARRVPLGVVALITPWNFPIAIPTWKLAPALILGNTVVIKPASLGPVPVIHVVRALEEAGLPAGVANLVIGPGTPFGQALSEVDGVKAVSFTGSVEIGYRLKSDLAARSIRIQLELGGKNPYIVWEDADLKEAARQAAEGAFFYAGQKCTATSRILVHRPVYESFVETFLDTVATLQVGEPLDEGTRVGPMVDSAARDNTAAWVARGVKDGGRMLAGGAQPDREGYYYPPTVIDGLSLDSALAQEEVFGPVVTLHPVADIAEAIHGANAARFGLSASLATHDLNVANAFMEGVEAGLVHINQPTAGVEYQTPFGGVKDSGYGPKEQAWSALDFYGDWRTFVVKTG